MPIEHLDLSVVLITLNEEANLARCLESVPAGAELIVIDSNSVDKTADLAANYGAKVYSRVFDDYASQKNFALEKASRSWILSLDADEELDEGLRDQIRNLVVGSNIGVAYRLRRRLVFMGKRMRFGRTTDYPVRLFRKGEASFRGAIHEKLVMSEGVRVKRLCSGNLLHYSYTNLEDYFSKFNNYTSRVASRKQREDKADIRGFLHVFRPWFEFFVRYFIRLGFLDGYPGYCYAYLSGVYKFVGYAKLREMNKSKPRHG